METAMVADPAISIGKARGGECGGAGSQNLVVVSTGPISPMKKWMHGGTFLLKDGSK